MDFVTDHLLKFLNQFPINPVNFALDRTRHSILESLGEQGVTVDPAKLTDKGARTLSLVCMKLDRHRKPCMRKRVF